MGGKIVRLPSGAKLVVNAAPFAEAKYLWQACAKELAHLKLSTLTEMGVDFVKNLFCIATGSMRIEKALRPCLGRCLYNGTRIDDATFEKEDARQDFFPVMEEVLKANVLPFLNGQLLKWGINPGQIKEFFPASKSEDKTT